MIHVSTMDGRGGGERRREEGERSWVVVLGVYVGSIKVNSTVFDEHRPVLVCVDLREREREREREGGGGRRREGRRRKDKSVQVE